MIAEFTDNMAGLEKKLGAERARMAAVSTVSQCETQKIIFKIKIRFDNFLN